jgi:cellobiose-specific phosphotransferase system component IIB
MSSRIVKKIRKATNKSAKIASLSAIQIQKLKEYENEMGVILIAYEKSKEISR